MSYEDDEYIRVCAEEGGEFLEFPKEADNSVLLSTLQSQFPTAIGLRYRGSSGAWRSLRVEENVLSGPKEGWGDRVYCVTVNETASKRKAEGDGDVERKKSRVNPLLQDMAVMNLPFTTDEQELKDYFEKNFGELEYCEVKKFKETGKSRGYGFIRFKDEETAQVAVKEEHHLSGRRIELKMKQSKPMKLFIGRCPDNTTTSDLEDYFSKFGVLTDVYIPKPFKNFAFITYANADDAKEVIAGSHQLQGNRLNVMERRTPEDGKANAADKERRMGGASSSNRDGYFSSRDRDRGDSHRSGSGGGGGGGGGGYSSSRDSHSQGSGGFSSSTGGYYSSNYVPQSQPSFDMPTQRQSPGSTGGGGGMDKDLKNMLMKYLASQ